QRRRPGEFPEAEVRLMQTLAAQSVLAIQNAGLFREIADKSEQLALASQHKSQFLANMSHELRTPLNAILGYSELLVDGIYGAVPERAMGVLERVQNNGKHLLALINDVLDLSKIEAGQLVLTFEDYALPDVVQSVVSTAEGLANTKGLKFSADVAPGLPTGHGDARRLSQVLLNLVGNAVKFTHEGEVAIRAMAENGHFVLTVRDTGPGIAPGAPDKIFRDLMTSAGYELIEAVDGIEGVAAAEREKPDLILMDIQLPGIDGYEATRRIRGIPALAKVPIIAVTSYALSGDEAKTRAAGCDGYVAKPFSPRQLLAKVREFLP